MNPEFLARHPPAGLAGLEPSWSKLIHVARTDGVGRTWHLLDNAVSTPEVTLLCVHGNPSWSYLWRDLLRRAPAGVRVIAVDQLNMGFSQRTGKVRRLADRIDDLADLTQVLALDGPVVTVAHDWGGPVALGWVQRHRDLVRGVVLANTAVHQPEGSPAPRVIRLVRTPGLLRRVTVDTTGFIRGAAEMSHPRLSAPVREGYLAPYRTRVRRQGIADFVEDIPLEPEHPSAATLAAVAEGLGALSDTPVLLLWGAADPVFSDLYLHDLERRLPHADVHRFAGAGHFVTEDADVAGAVLAWVTEDRDRARPADPATRTIARGPSRPLWSMLDDPGADPERPAVVEMAPDRPTLSFGELSRRVDAVAAGFAESGVRPGDRVGLMIPPGIDLSTALYAIWRMGATAVLIDAGLGPRGMSRAFAAAAPDHLVGVRRALLAATILRWPGRRYSTATLPPAVARSLGVVADVATLATSDGLPPPPPGEDDLAAVVFTSGATGPSKGVRYLHRQVQAQRDVLLRRYRITGADRLVAAFAPFALYGPAMGITSVVPDMDVTTPGTLTATALGDAAVAIDATMVFASPAALVNVVSTSDRLTQPHREAFGRVRLLLSAGAPVRAELLRRANGLFPNAAAHTPYGMTEVLPVADIDLTGIDRVGRGDGVCVGHPVDGVEVMISPIGHHGRSGRDQTTQPGVLGEIVVRAAHARQGYDRLWHTGHVASQPAGWHRSGDVGHLDHLGQLWVGGRIGHVVTSSEGPIAPVGTEQAIEVVPGVTAAAVVGVGPTGSQVLAVVVQTDPPVRRPRPADLKLHDAVRAAVDHDVAAVFVVPALPVDRRHNSKIDRVRVAQWAARALAGGRLGRL